MSEHLQSSNTPIKNQHVIVVGGGLLGLEIAAALKKSNIRITIVQRGSRLMERQLDLNSSQILREDVKGRGINVYFNNEVKHVIRTDENTEMYATLKSGKKLYCNAIVYAVGTRPNIEIAQQAGLAVKRGVVINNYLRTSDESIFAIGEIAEHNNKLYGITAAAEKQALRLAGFISGDDTSYFKGTILMNILKFDDLDLCSIGEITFPKHAAGYEEVVFKDLSHGYYKKCIIYNDRMIGAILIGDKSEFLEFKNLIENGIELSEKRTELLRGSVKKESVIGTIVCSCNHVGVGNIKNAIHNNCHSLDKICNKTMAGTACGSCKPEVNEILQKELPNILSEQKSKMQTERKPIDEPKAKPTFIKRILSPLYDSKG